MIFLFLLLLGGGRVEPDSFFLWARSLTQVVWMEWSGVESRTQGKERARTVQNTSNRTTVRTNVQYKTQYSTDISILYVTRRFLLSLVVSLSLPSYRYDTRWERKSYR